VDIRHIHATLLLGVQLMITHVGQHADDRNAQRVEAEELSDRASAGKIELCECFVHDDTAD
jgi:hypothetical protein